MRAGKRHKRYKADEYSALQDRSDRQEVHFAGRLGGGADRASGAGADGRRLDDISHLLGERELLGAGAMRGLEAGGIRRRSTARIMP